MSNIQFDRENSKLLQFMLETAIYSKLRLPIEDQRSGYYIELNVTPVCNQECEYCYLYKYGDKLYPKEIRSPKTILSNMRALLNYFHEIKVNPRKIDLFSGEIWSTKFGYDVLDVMLEFIRSKKLTPELVMIPSNCSFVYNKKTRDKIQEYIDKFRDAGTDLVFSISIDGLYIEEQNRPFKDKEANQIKNNDSSYDEIFRFAKKNQYGFHPMVAAGSIEKWIDNFNWWVRKLDKFGFYNGNRCALMTLEVRNDEWTDEKIIGYLKYLDNQINQEFRHIYNRDKRMFARFASGYVNKIAPSSAKYDRYKSEVRSYAPYMLSDSGSDFTCGIKQSIIFRLGDLSIGPCHRTHYPELIYGKYEVKDGKIVGLTANNVQLANRIYNVGYSGSIYCDRCAYTSYCIKGCMGAQFEANREPMLPCDSVCELEKAKIVYLYHKYTMSSWYPEYATTECKHMDKSYQRFKDFANRLDSRGDKAWIKWKEISKSIVSEID